MAVVLTTARMFQIALQQPYATNIYAAMVNVHV